MKRMIALGLAASMGLAGSITLEVARATAATAVTSHVTWCEQQYRSYNQTTDAYLGFDGLYHRCVSPFGGAQTLATVNPSVPNDVTPARKNPNGLGSGTTFRLYPNDSEGGNNGTNAGP